MPNLPINSVPPGVLSSTRRNAPANTGDKEQSGNEKQPPWMPTTVKFSIKEVFFFLFHSVVHEGGVCFAFSD